MQITHLNCSSLQYVKSLIESPYFSGTFSVQCVPFTVLQNSQFIQLHFQEVVLHIFRSIFKWGKLAPENDTGQIINNTMELKCRLSIQVFNFVELPFGFQVNYISLSRLLTAF